MIELDTAKAAATFLEKMACRGMRGFYIADSKPGEPVSLPTNGWTLKRIIGFFVSNFKLPYWEELSEQFYAKLIARGFSYQRISELYEESCTKHGVATSPLAQPRSDPTKEPSNWPDGYYADGIEVHLLEGTKSTRIGPWIEALTNVVDESKKHVGIYVRFFAHIAGARGAWVHHVIELDDLSSDGSKMFQALEAAGYRISGERKARGALRKLIQGAPETTTNEIIMRYSRPGWHGDEFVLPTGVVVDSEIVDSGIAHPDLGTNSNNAFVIGGVNAERGGTFEDWCEHVRDEIWSGDTPQFAIGMLAGLSGIISSRLACDHPTVYFTGPTASGKTTSQIIGAGMVANPSEGQGVLFGVADAIDIHRGLGTCLHVDDPTKRPSFASAKKIESLVYGLYERTASTFSSVLTLERLIEKAKGTMSEGIRRRVLTIDTDHIERIDIGRAMAIKSAAKRYYGHGAEIFAQQVCDTGVDALHDRVQGCTRFFVGQTNDPELYGIAWIAGILLSAAQIGELCELVPEDGAEQIFPVLQDAVNDWIGRRREGSGLAVIEALASEARPLGERLEGQVWIGQGHDGGNDGRLLYVRTDRLDRGQVRQIKSAGRLIELNDNNVAHNYLPQPDGRFLRHYRVRSLGGG